MTKDNQIRQQLLHDFEQSARRIPLQHVYYGTAKEKHLFDVKSNSNPPVQQSLALESYLEEVKISLREITLIKPKNNLLPAQHTPLKGLKSDQQITLKKTDKGTNTVVKTKKRQIKEGQIQPNEREHYSPLESTMVGETATRVPDLINKLYHGNFIDKNNGSLKHQPCLEY